MHLKDKLKLGTYVVYKKCFFFCFSAIPLPIPRSRVYIGFLCFYVVEVSLKRIIFRTPDPPDKLRNVWSRFSSTSGLWKANFKL